MGLRAYLVRSEKLGVRSFINGKWKIENGKLNAFCVIVFVLIEFM